MPVQSFTIAEILPQLIAGTTTYVNDVYNETFGLSGMAKEMPVQMEPKIRVVGKVYKRPVASDIPEASEAPLIKDTKFTDEMFTAPEYGRGFAITTNDLIQNQNYLVAFNGAKSTIGVNKTPVLIERARMGTIKVIEMIKRAEDNQVKQILETGTIAFDNYTTIDFDRDTNNSVVITTANRKWTIANAATMKPFQDIDDWTEQVADRGNSGGAEFVVLLGRNAFKAYVNSDAYKDDSNQRRNYKVERRDNLDISANINVPKGAVYRESILKNSVGVAHIFTYNETYTNASGNQAQWLDDDKVYIIASDNIIQRQPVQILTMDELLAYGTLLRKVLNSIPAMKGWLISPEWNRITNRAFVMGVYKKFLTQPLTINKTFNATVNS
jgi:hypothetical protein